MRRGRSGSDASPARTGVWSRLAEPPPAPPTCFLTPARGSRRETPDMGVGPAGTGNGGDGAPRTRSLKGLSAPSSNGASRAGLASQRKRQACLRQIKVGPGRADHAGGSAGPGKALVVPLTMRLGPIRASRRAHESCGGLAGARQRLNQGGTTTGRERRRRAGLGASRTPRASRREARRPPGLGPGCLGPDAR